MKRFWREVRVAERGLLLDGKPVRTPGRAPLILPSEALANAVAAEWAAVGETLDPRAMPLTGLANAAIDRVAPDPAGFAAGLAVYGESDLLYYRADGPAELVARQAAAWDPLLAWARGALGVDFVVTTGVMHRPQPAETIARLGAAIAAYPPFALAALSPIVTITGSLVGALAHAAGAADAEQLWLAATIDEEWQAEQWGDDDLALQAKAARRRAYEAAVRFLGLLG